MPETNFSIKEALSFGWYKMKSHFSILIGIVFLQFFIYFSFSFFERMIQEIDSVFIALLVYFIYLFVSTVINMGIIKISLKIHDNEKIKSDDLIASYPLFLTFMIASIISSLLIFFGLIAFLIPGIILAIKFFFVDYLIVDKKLGPIESLKKSWQITKGNKWNLFLFILLLAFINILGFICLIIGLLITIPTTLMATAFVYRKLLTQVEAIQTGRALL